MPTQLLDRRLVRMILTALMLGLLFTALAACGGAGTVAADPETRVKNFFQDFQNAINDPDINKPETQEKWAETLSGYIKPNDRPAAKEQFKQALNELGSGLGALTGGAEADIRLNVAIEGLETKKQSEEGNNAVVELTSGSIKFSLSGEDVASLGLPEDQLSQTLPISEFAKEAGAGSDNTIDLEKVDNVWYLLIEQE